MRDAPLVNDRTLARRAREEREPGYDILPLFVERWSPRAMTGGALPDSDLLPLFEAARWAPSSFNSQFWRFVICRRTDPEWTRFLGLLNDGNRSWAKQAAALVVTLALRHHPYNHKPAPTHMMDVGAACQNMALEGARRGLVVHGMEGFDYAKARDVCGATDEFDVLAMWAIGVPGKVEDLPEKLREREKPSQRLPLEDIVSFGRLGRAAKVAGERAMAAA